MPVRRAALAALAAFALAAPPALAQEAPPRTVSVSGTGEVRAAPDEAALRLGVTVREETAGAAAEAARERAAALVAALTPEPIAEADLRTTNVSLQPVYGDPSGELRRQGEGPQIVAYEARRDYEARVGLDRLGAAIDAAVEAGANEIGGVTLRIAEPAPLATEARREAFAAARAKAETLAEAAGARLGAAVRIAEGAPLDPGPGPMMRMAMMESADAVAPGELTVSVTVNVVFALEAGE